MMNGLFKIGKYLAEIVRPNYKSFRIGYLVHHWTYFQESWYINLNNFIKKFL